MSNHGNKPFEVPEGTIRPEDLERFRRDKGEFSAQLLSKHIELDQEAGPTGRYPEGKIREDDQGEVKLQVFVQEDKVIINFGTKLSWVAFTEQQAEDMISALREKITILRE